MIDLIAPHKIQEWRASPVKYVHDVFGVKPAASFTSFADPIPAMDWFQQEMLEALTTHDRLALQACKGPGKTCGLAWGMLWFLTVMPYPKVAAVSITGDNLRDNLWTELKKWIDRSRMLQQMFVWTASRVYHREAEETWWASARAFPKTATAEEQAAALSGLHGDHLMFVLDECGSIPIGVLETADAGLANRVSDRQVAKLMLAGNPTTIDGSLYYAAVDQRHNYWVKEIDADPANPKRARRISAEHAQSKIDDLGRDHDWVRVNILGKFPHGQENALIGLDDVTHAYEHLVLEEEIKHAPRLLGVDVARMGSNRTVLLKRQGRVVFDDVKQLRSRDEVQIAREIVRIIEDWDPVKIFIDTTGVGGGVYDILVHAGHAGRCVAVNSAAKKGIDKQFLNLRIQMWAAMARWLRGNDVHLPRIAGLTRELTAPTFWYRTEDNKMQLESKDDLKARGIESPDVADALALTFAFPVAPSVASAKGTAGATAGKALTERTDGRWRR